MKKREVKLNLFDVQTTGQASLSAEMKTFYENTLIDMAEPKLCLLYTSPSPRDS